MCVCLCVCLLIFVAQQSDATRRDVASLAALLQLCRCRCRLGLGLVGVDCLNPAWLCCLPAALAWTRFGLQTLPATYPFNVPRSRCRNSRTTFTFYVLFTSCVFLARIYRRVLDVSCVFYVSVSIYPKNFRNISVHFLSAIEHVSRCFFKCPKCCNLNDKKTTQK